MTTALGHPTQDEAGKPQRILVINAKGGCGKTTIATNLAAALHAQSAHTLVVDFDPQGSASEWLQLRAASPQGEIPALSALRHEVSVSRCWLLPLPPGTQWVIMDAPAALHGVELQKLVHEADILIIPVMPSPIDIEAMVHFIKDLFFIAKVRQQSIPMAIIANRVKTNTIIFRTLQKFLQALRIPVIAVLRDSQDYIHAFEQGLALVDLPAGVNEREAIQWRHILEWVKSRSNV
ncbi:MAG: ParA family protein [Gammaproteobacteria bacterium]|nr:ParA family protein [Gammaproteobacteria bacterium]